MTRLRIRVPATSANLGPGFDTLALALDLADEVEVELTAGGDEVVLDAVRGAEDLAVDRRDNLFCDAYRLWGRARGVSLPGAQFTAVSRIPIGKGFGSSAACIVAGLAAAAWATGAMEDTQGLLDLAAGMEGHPDNAIAAVLGGVTVAYCDGGRVRALRIAGSVPLGVSLFVPCDELLTERARKALPDTIPLADAVFDLGRLAYLTAAFSLGEVEGLRGAMQDRLHQPYRTRLIPGLEPVIRAALGAGAYGAALSGGGPSVIALGPAGAADRIAAAMESCAHQHAWAGHGLVTRIRERGMSVEVLDP